MPPGRGAGTGRDDLLAAGVALVAEGSVGEVLDHLRVRDLAAGAGLTAAAFYHYWPSQEAYRREVLRVLLAGDRPEVGVLADELPLARAADRAFAAVAADPHHRLMLGLWAQHDDEAHAALARRVDRAAGAWAARVSSELVRAGRAPQPPWTPLDLGRLLVALTDGLAIQHATDPTVLHRRRGRQACGLLAAALVEGATRPGRPAPVVAPPLPADPAPEVPGRHLVDLGVAAALERPVGNALDHVRAQDVAGRAGLTEGAFFHHWPTQDAYRDDLTEALLSARRYVAPGTVAGLVDDLAEAPALDDAVREATTWYWGLAAKHPDNAVQFGFTAVGDRRLTEHLARVTTALREEWLTVLGAALDRFGLRPRPPHDLELLVLGMEATINGLILRAGLGADDLGPDLEGWTWWGRACAALLGPGAVGPAL